MEAESKTDKQLVDKRQVHYSRDRLFATDSNSSV